MGGRKRRSVSSRLAEGDTSGAFARVSPRRRLGGIGTRFVCGCGPHSTMTFWRNHPRWAPAPWAGFVTVTNRQADKAGTQEPIPAGGQPAPLMRQTQWQLGLLLLKQKQYGCWHLTPLKRLQPRPRGPPGRQSPRPLSVPSCTRPREPRKGAERSGRHLSTGDFHSRPQLPIYRQFSHLGRTPGAGDRP